MLIRNRLVLLAVMPAALLCTAVVQAADPLVYRGVLNDNGAPANGRYDLEFRLRGGKDSPLSMVGPVRVEDVQVSDGAFAIVLPVDQTLLPASGWIEVAVRDGGSEAVFEPLPDKQPFALFAKAVCPGSWEVVGNPGIAAGNFLGTTDNAPLELRVNNARVFRASQAQIDFGIGLNVGTNVIAGHASNTAPIDAVGATIAGGGGSFGASLRPNAVGGQWGTVGGGSNNAALGGHAVVAGGIGNQALGGASSVGGGENNLALEAHAAVAGGAQNAARGSSSFVGGGFQNQANGQASVVPGGDNNFADGDYSFAAGRRAKIDAVHDGTFVWADGTDADFASTGVNQFLIRAGGGVGLGTGAPFEQLTINGNLAFTRDAARSLYVGQEPDNTTSGKSLTVRAGSASNTGIPFQARLGGDLVLQAGNAFNGNQANQDGGDVILRSGANWRTADTVGFSGGDIVLQTGTHLNVFNERMRVLDTGEVSIAVLGAAGATSLCRNASNQIATCSSSARYKDAIVDSALGLATVAALRTVDYVWKDSGDADVGLVAEEVAAVAPRLVTRNAQGAIEGVKYDRLAAVLVQAMQQQQATIETLQQQLAAQQTSHAQSLRTLTERVDALLATPSLVLSGVPEATP